MEQNQIYQKFLKENPMYGFLKVQIYLANQAIPVPDVKIKIQKEIEGETFTIFEGKTDESGIVTNIKLPAPDIKDPDTPTFASYTLIVDHPSYQGPTTFSIPVYSNQKMIQYVNLIPLFKEDKNG